MIYKAVSAACALILTLGNPVCAGAYSASFEESEAVLKLIRGGMISTLRVHRVFDDNQSPDYAWATKVIKQDGELRLSMELCQLQIGSTLQVLGVIPDPDWPERMSSVVVRYEKSDIYEEGVDFFTCGESEVLVMKMLYFPALLAAAEGHDKQEAGIIAEIKKVLEEQ
jgi:hypothetical protein